MAHLVIETSMRQIAGMASLETICRAVRMRLGLPPIGAPVEPDWLLTMLGDELDAEPQPFCERDGLFGNKVRWNENAPRSTQRHQMARACCAHLLRGMRQLQHSPGRLAEMLCGTSAVDTQVEDIRRELYELRAMHAYAGTRTMLAHACSAPSVATFGATLELYLASAAAEQRTVVASHCDVLLIRPRRRG